MEDDIRRRSACDRCHSQKLRCTKRPEADICDRCKKARARCAFSPFRQKKELRKDGDTPATDFQVGISNSNIVDQSIESNTTAGKSVCAKRRRVVFESKEPSLDPGLDFNYSTTNVDQASDSIEVDWNSNSLHDLISDAAFGQMEFENPNVYFPFELCPPTFQSFRGSGEKSCCQCQLRLPPNQEPSLCDTTFGTLLNPLPDPDPAPLALALQTPRLPLLAAEVRKTPNPSIAQCVRKLTGLSLSLYEHSTTIPPQSIYYGIPDNESFAETIQNRCSDYGTYCVDTTFQLTQDLVDIYPTFIDIFAKRKIFQASSPAKTETSPETVYFGDTQMKEKLQPGVPSLSNPLSLDHSSILLILSCHLRLIDIYDELFKHMKICTEQNGLILNHKQASFNGPQLKIGNFVPPPATAIPMQMLLLLHFAAQLCDHAIELERHIREHEEMVESPGSSPSENSSDGGAKALSLASAEKVKDRASSMLQHLNTLRSFMLREGHLA